MGLLPNGQEKTLEFSAPVKTTANKNCFPNHEMLKMFNIWLVHMTKDHKNDEISKAGIFHHPSFTDFKVPQKNDSLMWGTTTYWYSPIYWLKELDVTELFIGNLFKYVEIIHLEFDKVYSNLEVS